MTDVLISEEQQLLESSSHDSPDNSSLLSVDSDNSPGSLASSDLDSACINPEFFEVLESETIVADAVQSESPSVSKDLTQSVQIPDSQVWEASVPKQTHFLNTSATVSVGSLTRITTQTQGLDCSELTQKQFPTISFKDLQQAMAEDPGSTPPVSAVRTTIPFQDFSAPLPKFVCNQSIEYLPGQILMCGFLDGVQTLRVPVKSLVLFFQYDASTECLSVPLVIKKGRRYDVKQRELASILKLGETLATYLR